MSPEKRYIICLANSYKNKGRCLAGIEIKTNDSKYSIVMKQDGTPQWLRPVSRTEHGEIPDLGFELLDILEIEYAGSCPKEAHSEDAFYSSIKKVPSRKFDTDILESLCDRVHGLIFFNMGKAVPADVFKQEDHSLMFIKVSGCTYFSDDSDKLRVKFQYNDIPYDLPITDPAFVRKVKIEGLDRVNEAGNYYFTVSLGVAFNEWHHKLIAGIVAI